MSANQINALLFITIDLYILGFIFYLIWCNAASLSRVAYIKREKYRARLKLSALMWPIMVVGLFVMWCINIITETFIDAELFKKKNHE